MEYYESLWEGTPSAYKDYEKTKAHVLQLKDYIEANAGEWVLTHIDAVPDNFLFVEENGKEEMQFLHAFLKIFLIFCIADPRTFEIFCDFVAVLRVNIGNHIIRSCGRRSSDIQRLPACG